MTLRQELIEAGAVAICRCRDGDSEGGGRNYLHPAWRGVWDRAGLWPDGKDLDGRWCDRHLRYAEAALDAFLDKLEAYRETNEGWDWFAENDTPALIAALREAGGELTA